MATLITDLSNGQTLTETADEYSLTRVFKVKIDSTDGAGTIFDVKNTNGIPSIGDRHPRKHSISVKSKSVQTNPSDKALYTVTCVYTKTNAEEQEADDAAPAQISVGSTTTTFRTDKDKDDKQMLLTPSSGSGPDNVKKREPQTFITDVSRILGVFRLTRKETESPMTKATTYTNKLNSVIFLGYPVGQVYCDSIQGESSDGGDTYSVTYSFTIDPLGWKARGVYTIDNEPSPDVDEDGNQNSPSKLIDWGLEKSFDVLKEADFNLLNLQ